MDKQQRPNALRKPASVTLIVIAGIVLAAAVITVFAEHNLFNSGRFADRAESTLASASVRQLAAKQLSNQVIGQVNPDVVAVRPLLDAATAAIIDTASFKRLFRSAVLQLHHAALNHDLNGAVLVIANVGVLMSDALHRLSPDVAKKIPAGLDAKLLSAAQGGVATDVAQTAITNRFLAWLLPLAAMLLFGAGIAVAPDRRVAIAGVGLSVAGAGALVGAAYLATRTIVLHRTSPIEGVERSAAEAIWNAFLGDLFIVAIGVSTTGAAIAAAASGTMRTGEIDRRIHELASSALRPPRRTGRRIVWAIGAIAIGIWMIGYPRLTLETIAFVLGIYMIFRGLNELITLVMPNAKPAAERSVGKSQISYGMLRIVAGFAAVCVAAVGLAAVFVDDNSLEKLGFKRSSLGCNGAQSLCDKPFDDVAFAMTHNSMSDKTDPSWIFPEQDGSIAQQLNDGIHGLAIDAYYGYPGRRVYTDEDLSSPTVRDSLTKAFGTKFVNAADRIRRSISRPTNTTRQIYLCHGFCELGALALSTALSQIRTYLNENPHEVIVIVFEDYVNPADLANALEAGGIASHAYRGPIKPPWPTLQQMISRDQRVLLLTENAKPTVPWMHLAYDVMQETPFHFGSAAQLRKPSSCDPNRGEPQNSVFLVNHWVDTAPAPRLSIARNVNRRSFLQPRVLRCEKIRGLMANLISVNFYKQGDTLGVVDSLNGVH